MELLIKSGNSSSSSKVIRGGEERVAEHTFSVCEQQSDEANKVARMKWNGNKKGFTLIELVLVMSIIGILLTIAQPMFKNSVRKAKETVLKENLFAMRSAIDQYYTDNGTYPPAIEDLVAKGYMRAIPKDPTADGNAAWVTVPPVNSEETGVFDVKSSNSQLSTTGAPYSEW